MNLFGVAGKEIRNKQFNASKPRLSSTGDSNEPPPTPTSQASDASSSTLEVIRSSTAGAKEEANYELSVDLKQTKALFESTSSSSTVSRTSTRRSSFKTRRSSSASRSVSPSRSSRSSSTHSYTLKSRDDSDIADTPSDMAEIVRPSPAGTKEVVDVQPSFSISAAKNLFESSKGEKSDVDYSSPRRRQLKSDWATNANKEIPVVKEGSFIDNNGVVRPPSAGTKEKPDYQLESNALKARAAIFQQGKANDYKPRNRVQKEEKKVAAEIVNHRNDDESAPAAEEEFVPSIDQKAARSVFENQQEENAAKGVFTGEVQSANAQSSSEDEQEEAQQEEEEVVEEVEEVAAVAAEPATFEIEAIVEPVAPEPAVDEKEVEQDTPVVASRETNSSSSSSSVSEADSVDQAEQVAIVDDVADDVQAAELEAQQLQNEGKIGGPDTLGDFFSTPEPTNTNNNEQFSNFDLDTSSMFPVQSDTTITGDPEPATTADLDIMGGDDPFGMNLQPTIMNNNPPPSAGGFGSLDIFASPPPNTPANQTSSSPAPDPFAAFSTPGSDPFSLESKPTSDPFSMGAAEPAAPASADPFDLFGSMSQPPAANNTPAAPTAAGTDPFDLFG